MKICPNCGEVLFSVNSSSKEMECLSKGCGYSTVSKVACVSFISEIYLYEEKADTETGKEKMKLIKPMLDKTEKVSVETLF
jgi:hypothetical protein